jgi:hypothetical protein
LPTAVTLFQKYLANPDQAAPAFQAHYLLGAELEKMGKNKETRQFVNLRKVMRQ